MKVSQLIAQLKKLDPDAEVILQSDPEGNGYHEVSGADAAVYDGDDGYHDPSWSADDAGLEEEEWEKLKKSKKNQRVIIFP